jgi:monomeric sarcosine oxidase
MPGPNDFDVIIIGGGTMGTAAAWALARQGQRALVLEQFQHVHSFGSHSGETRIIRHAYAESPEYVPLVQRADQLWQDLEEESGERILIRSGGLELAAPGYTHARDARLAADIHGLTYEWLTPEEANHRWEAFRVPDGWDVLYSPDSGFLLTEPALRTMGAAAERLGARIIDHTPVTSWGSSTDGVWVSTSTTRFEAAALVVTAGAWSSALLKQLELPIEVRRKTLWWQQVDDPEKYRPDHFPVFITDSANGSIYGFPIHETPGLKIAHHAGGERVDPNSVDRSTKAGENSDCLALAAELLPSVTPTVIKSAVCLYSVTPDTDFLVDRFPSAPNVVFGAGFSGHGFKFTPAIGELLAELIVNPSANAMPRLALSRFG